MAEPGTRFFIVGVGASAGGIDALKLFFQNGPASPELGFVVITHLSRDHKSLLAEILQGFTEMPVHTAEDGMTVEPGTVYVAPERVTVTIRGGRLSLNVKLADADRHEHLRVIDDFFRSLAEDQADFAIGAILSGLDRDGTLGVKAIKEHGGLTIAQTANGTAPKFPDMPDNAIASGFIDLEVPAEQMIARLVAFAHGSLSLETKRSENGDAEIDVVASKEEIAEIVERQLGHDFRGYKDATFARRVRRRMVVQNLPTTTDYVAFLNQDTAEVTALFNDLLINVTRFFRDPEAFQTLADNVLPQLMNERSAKDVVRVWVPGCATGEEAFSIAILIREALDKMKSAPSVQIFATDIDEEALNVARSARFPMSIRDDLTEAGETLLSDWFLAGIHMTGYPRPDTDGTIHWHREGVLLIFPMGGSRYRIIGDLPYSEGSVPSDPSVAQVQDVVDRRGPAGTKLFDPLWLSGFRINGRKVAHYRKGRVFVAGDAAHIHSPAGGQGMNTGMQDAFNLAWKLAMVVRDDGPESLLDSYSAERSYVGDEVLNSVSRLTAVATLKNPIAQHVRNFAGHLALGLPRITHGVADTMSETAIHYPQSPLNGPYADKGLRPGERVPPVAGEAPVGAGAAPRFVLFATKTAAVTGLTEQFDSLVEPELRRPLQDGSVSLVRPDGYLACSATDPSTIADYLSQVVGQTSSAT